MLIKKIVKLFKILVYFKNPFTVIKFYKGRFKKGEKIKVIPRKGNSFYIARMGDLWLINKIINAKTVKVMGEVSENNKYIVEDGIFLRQGTSDTFVYKEVFIDECYSKNIENLDSNSVVIDIGSHIGLFSIYCSPKCKNIYAYEAHPENYSLALRNIKNKNIENIALFNLAVWSLSDQNINISDNKDGKTGENIISKRQDNDGGLKINTITITDIFKRNNINYCDLLKMDIEGAEYSALFSTSNKIFSKIKNICMEYHLDIINKYTIEDLKIKLIKNNFDIEIKKINNNIGLLYAKNKNIK